LFLVHAVVVKKLIRLKKSLKIPKGF